MKILRTIKRNIPNTITCLNLASGVLACIYALRSDETFGTLHGYHVSFLLIAVAAIFDFCDGLSARLLGAVSAIGKELDSLSDSVSFGIAPSLLVFMLLETAAPNSWIKYLAVIVAVCGVVRLARFNTDATQKVSFLGLPIPANAIFWIGFCAWQYEHMELLEGNNIWWLVALTVVMSLMMVCRLRMFSLKIKNLSWSGNWHRFLIVGIAIIVIAIQGIPGMATTIVAYIILSALTHRRTKRLES